MTGLSWTELLEAYYKHDGWMWRSTKQGESHPNLPKENNLKSYQDGDESIGDFYETHNILSRSGLVENSSIHEIGTNKAGADDNVIWTKLTEKGFNVAHEREMVRYQDTTNQQAAKTNKRIAELTVVLASAAVIQALASLFSANYISSTILAQGIGTTIALGIVTTVYIIVQ